MINTRSIMALSTATVLAIALAPQNSLADATNGATVGTIDFQFENAPPFTLINWVARLTREPVVVPYDLTFLVTYRTNRKVTPDEALRDIDGVLLTNGYHLVKTDESYYRIMKVVETNSVSNRSHIDLEIQGDKLIVDGKPIQSEDLTQTLVPLVGPETEIWIQDAYDTQGFGLTSAVTSQILMQLHKARPKSICIKLMPPPT
jgi:hypothetical protein